MIVQLLPHYSIEHAARQCLKQLSGLHNYCARLICCAKEHLPLHVLLMSNLVCRACAFAPKLCPEAIEIVSKCDLNYNVVQTCNVVQTVFPAAPTMQKPAPHPFFVDTLLHILVLLFVFKSIQTRADCSSSCSSSRKVLGLTPTEVTKVSNCYQNSGLNLI
jgi:hypothetical protein